MELRECLAHVLGVEVPPAEGGEPDCWRGWLGGRNLGLVPVADPASFAWPGHWIARDGKGRHAVMFGSPSGPVTEPIGEIERGWVVARLDLALDGYGDDPGSGTVEALLLAEAAEALPARVGRAVAVAGRGLEGDRYHAAAGTFRPGNALTLVEAEALEALPLGFEEARRNVVTRGVDLNALVGRRFRVGEVVCAGARLCEPCAHLDRLNDGEILRPLVHRGGLRADVVAGGTLRAGDVVEPV